MKHLVHTAVILIIFNILCSYSIQSQSIQEQGRLFIQNYDDKNFNTSGKQIWAVLQDKRGVMYFGNIDGLLEFDGSNWRLIEMPNKSTVRSMAIDSTGRIYIGAKSDIGYIEADTTGIIQYISLLEKIPEEHRNFDDVWETFVIDNQVIFRTNFYAFILKNNKIKILKSENRFHVSFCVNNRFYVREWETGLLTLINDSLKIVPHGGQFAKERIYVMLPYEDDKILIVTRTQGIFIYSPNAEKPNRFSKPVRFQGVDNFIIKNQIYSGAKLDNKHFVFGSLQDGLIIIDKNGTIVRHINKKSGLLDNTVMSICVDSQKNIWAGLNNGLSYIIVNSPFSIFSEKTGLQGSVYTAIYYQNQLYAGTSLGIFCKDRQHDFFMLNNTKGQSWYLSEIMGELYCAHHEGILRINKNSAENISTYGNTWNFLELVSHPNYVLAGTSDNGLILLEYKNNKLIVKNKIKGFDESSRWVQEDNEGNIWVSHENKGIFRLKLNEKLDSVAKLDFFNTKHGLPANTYNYVFKIKTDNQSSRIVFGTEKGIYKYDPKSKCFVPDETLNKLLKKVGLIDIFTQDKKGNIWYKEGNEKGVLLLQSDGTYKSRKTPFLKIKSIVISIYVIDTANILFCTYDGIIHYNSQIAPDYDVTYPVLIRQVLAGDSFIFGGAEITDNIIKLPYEKNALQFTYSALYYEDHDKTQYSYYLEGFEKKWSEWSLKTEKEYTNLPEGSYTFYVKAKNIYGIESITATYNFRILPPWYRTVLAYIFYCITAILIVWISGFLYSRRLKAANIRLEKIVSERTAEIQKQKEELETTLENLKQTQAQLIQSEKMASLGQLTAGVAHEINNPVNYITGGIASLSICIDDIRSILEKYKEITPANFKEKLLEIEETKEHLDFSELIQEIENLTKSIRSGADRTTEIVQGLRSFSRLDDDEFDFIDLHKNIDNTLAILNSKFEDSIKIIKEYGNIPKLQCFPGKLNQMFMYLLLNAIEAIDNEGQITIKTGTVSGSSEICISIIDTGKGIPDEIRDKIFEPFFTTKPVGKGAGLGLSVAHSIVEEHNGKIEVESETGKGTTIRIILPIFKKSVGYT